MEIISNLEISFKLYSVIIQPIYNQSREIYTLPINQEEQLEVKNYIEELLDLYTEDEYENYLENIIYHYCNRRFNMSKNEAIKILYEVIEDLK